MNLSEHHIRSRRSASPAEITEHQVETSMVHPCYWVNHHTPEYCIDSNDASSCWTIDLCRQQFHDFDQTNGPSIGQPNRPVIFEEKTDKYGLETTMSQIHEIILAKIEEVADADHADYKRELIRKANSVQQERISFNQARVIHVNSNNSHEAFDLIHFSSEWINVIKKNHIKVRKNNPN